MNQEFWNSIESKYPLGKLIYGQVEFHAPFGVFVNLGDKESGVGTNLRMHFPVEMYRENLT
jgi:ribosomal protein S1